MLLVRLSAETACSPGKDFELFQSSEQREAALQPGHSSGHHGVGVCVCVSNPSVSYPPSTRSPDTTPIPSSPHLRIRREPQASRGVSALLGATKCLAWDHGPPPQPLSPTDLRRWGPPRNSVQLQNRCTGTWGQGSAGVTPNTSPLSRNVTPTPNSPSPGNSVWGVCQRRRY